ncbi:MAG: hypothetical protein QM500_19860 [Methylococcales bacterium]
MNLHQEIFQLHENGLALASLNDEYDIVDFYRKGMQVLSVTINSKHERPIPSLVKNSVVDLYINGLTLGENEDNYDICSFYKDAMDEVLPALIKVV